ncbi:hypothetical protein [Telluribacter sp.]|jgi:hypothetical protein|uniref:hypothetical protein n=1 Tax=Telluribacter sp. TaxID=1978767 RepID=UPI002E163871|nr:hypothetical protein [Telluribacter sp.]
MKSYFKAQPLVAGMLLAFFSFTSSAALPASQPDSVAAGLVGTWTLISYNYVGLPQTLAPDKVCLKTITPSHYSWTYHCATTKEVISTAGGSYSLGENICTEKVDFLQGVGADFRTAAYKTCNTTPAQVEELYQAEKRLQVELSGDTMTVRGTLANGNSIAETWQRVK